MASASHRKPTTPSSFEPDNREWSRFPSNLFLNMNPLPDNSDKNPCFAVFPKYGGQTKINVYVISLDKWHSIPLSFLPAAGVHCMASAGGLVCCHGNFDGNSSLCVCNPVLNKFKILPPLTQQDTTILNVEITVDRFARQYEVIVVGFRRFMGNVTVEIFDSETNAWSSCSAIPSLPLQTTWKFSGRVNGRLCILTDLPSQNVLTYDPRWRTWGTLEVPIPPPNLRINRIMDLCEGRFMVAGEILSDRKVATAVGVWEIDTSVKEWKKISQMPTSFFREFQRCNPPQMSHLGFSTARQGDLICFTRDCTSRIIAFNIRIHRWFSLPKNSSLKPSESSLFGCPFDLNFQIEGCW